MGGQAPPPVESLSYSLTLPQLDGNLSILSESEICDFSDTLSEFNDGLPIPIIQPLVQGVYCGVPTNSDSASQ